MQLDFFLARFAAEVGKVDGNEYPGKIIYVILNSIQTYLRVEYKRNVTWIDNTSRVLEI